MNDKFTMIKLLSDQTRFQILSSLLDFDQLCVSELENLLGIKQANTSKHLKKMKESGIVDSKREGNTVYYHVTQEFLQDHEGLIRYLIV
jgi:ArsR family transcriptional regulator